MSTLTLTPKLILDEVGIPEIDGGLARELSFSEHAFELPLPGLLSLFAGFISKEIAGKSFDVHLQFVKSDTGAYQVQLVVDTDFPYLDQIGKLTEAVDVPAYLTAVFTDLGLTGAKITGKLALVPGAA